MARKDLPWQADFNAQDKKRIVRWMIDQHGAWDTWGRPLATLEWWKGRTPRTMLFTVPDFQGNRVTMDVAVVVNPRLRTADVRKAFRVLGLPHADAYIKAHRAFVARNRPVETEDDIFRSLWINLSHMGAGANLHGILTADKADARRWKAALKKAGKTWADVYLSTKAAAEIADAILGEMLGKQYQRGSEALRTRFKKYLKELFGKTVRT
ncbi:hypothetical protein [Candidatus Deferrimicrobium sp.]|uniref:hypothetical protein n=1 Tax=Candidatus Deferrimicrobium sp. TaxID=3060586 RepID=UPI002725A5EB|nr:hypothetical protein [Candidatus Deferrimicrobium sp.]MDO8739415.1 hypothetical protein [Candidatus Deferrimicrobium sp.]